MKHLYIVLALCCNIILCSCNATNTNKSPNGNKTIFASGEYTVEKQLKEYFENIESLVASFVQQSSNNNEKCKGTIYILRNKKKPQMRIKYENGQIQDIFMSGRYISIIDRKTKKKKTYSILTTPLYALLSGNLKLSDLKPNIIVNKNDVTVNIKSNNQDITIVFSTIKTHAGQVIDKLIAWTIDDGKTIINVGFDTKSYFLNNKSKIPNGIYDIKSIMN